jgi:hypothetical protein
MYIHMYRAVTSSWVVNMDTNKKILELKMEHEKFGWNEGDMLGSANTRKSNKLV